MFRKVGDEIAAREHLRTFNTQEVCNIIWAFATAKHSHSLMFIKIGDVIASDENSGHHSQVKSLNPWHGHSVHLMSPILFFLRKLTDNRE